jgi:hypothetical protein
MSEEKKGPKLGRPTKYTEEMPQRLVDFFNKDVFSGTKVNALPLFEKFAWEQGITMNTLYSWTQANPVFLGAYELCRQKQKEMLIEGGMLGAYKENFTKFICTNMTDLKEKTVTENTNKEIKITYAYKKEENVDN